MLKCLMVILMLLATQATTMAQAPAPEPDPTPVPAPVPDPISTPGAGGGIGNVATCALLAVEITSLEEQIADTRQTLIATNIHAPLFWPLARLLAELEAELIMLQLEYALLCGGEPPVTKECANAKEQLLRLHKAVEFAEYVLSEARRGYDLYDGQLDPLKQQAAIQAAEKALENARKALGDFEWPEECGPKPVVFSGIPTMTDPTIVE